MTDRPPTRIDEFASAAVDGEASAAELDTFAAESGSTARATTFQAISDAHRSLGQEQAAASGGAEARIAAALAADPTADVGRSGAPPLDPPTLPSHRRQGEVVPLHTRSDARSRTPPLRIVASVAAAVLLVLAGTVILRVRSGGVSTAADAPATTSSSRSNDEESDLRKEAAGAVDAPPAVVSPPATTSMTIPQSMAPAVPTSAASASPIDLPSLGDFADADQVLATARQHPEHLAPSEHYRISCPPSVPLTATSTVARAIVDGNEVLVVRNGNSVTTASLSTCSILVP